MEQPPSSVSIPTGGDPFEHLLAQVKEAAAGVYDVLGEIGRSRSGNVVYLARELETGSLLALKLTRATNGGDGEFDLSVARTLEMSVPGLENRCPECKETLPDWDRFCFHCGADLSGQNARPADDEADAIEQAVREATVGQYEIVGKMDRSDGGGLVFFARDVGRDKLVALRLKRDSGGDDDSYSIGETQILRPLASELAATQMAPHVMMGLPAPSAPAPAAPQVAPSPPAAAHALGGSPRGGNSRLLYAGAAGIALLGIILAVLLGGDEEVDTAPVDTVVATAPPVVDTTPRVAPPPVTPPPAAIVVPDSGFVVLRAQLPAGARLTVDGRVVRRWPVQLASGSHVLVATAPGHDTARTRLMVSRAETARWQPSLRALPGVVAAPAPAPTPSPGAPAPAPAARATCARAFARGEWTAALPLCRDEAMQGSREAQRSYGELLLSGRAGNANPIEAVAWFSRAATAGDASSMVQLGLMYRDGRGVRKDEKQSVAWFRQAAQAGNAVGMMELGVMLDGGRGTDRDDAQAAQWFRRASDAGNPVATRRLGRLYERGEGVPRSEPEAAALYRQAAEKGDAEAQYQLGRFYKDGRGGLPRDASAARDWLRRAAEQNHPAARDELRKMGGD